MRAAIQSIGQFCCCVLGTDDDCEVGSEEARLQFLATTADDIKYRSGIHQLPSLFHDGTERKVMETLKALVRENHYGMAQLAVACSGRNIWLYTVPTPKGCVSINPDTHFRYHRVLRIYLGTEADWRTYKAQTLASVENVSFSLEDTAFEETE